MSKGTKRRHLRWLRQRPLLLALWYEHQNRWERRYRSRVHPALLTLVLAVACIAAWVVVDSCAATALSLYDTYPRWVFFGTMLYTTTAVYWKRKTLRHRQSESWMAALPIAPRSLRRFVTLRILLALSLHALVVVLLICVAAAGVGDTVALHSTSSMMLAAGFALGAGMGWYFSKERAANGIIGSRYVPRRRSVAALRPSLKSLSDEPIYQVFAWLHPGAAIRIVLPALLMMPAGVPALAALAAILCWLCSCYLLLLLKATLHVARTSGDWLKATPISLKAFAWTLAKRSMLHQCLGVLLNLALLHWLGAPVSASVQAAEIWLSLTVLLGSAGIARGYCGSGGRLRMAISLGLVAIAATLRQGSAVPLSLLIAGWQLRDAAHTRGAV